MKNINDIHLCEDADHVNAVFQTGQRANHLLFAGGLLLAVTILVAPYIGFPSPEL